MANWVRYSLPPFLSVSPLKSMRSGGAIPPPQKGYLSDTCAIPHENKANGCDTPLCDTISKRYCAIWGGISHWAAKPTSRRGLRRASAISMRTSPQILPKASFRTKNTTIEKIVNYYAVVFLLRPPYLLRRRHFSERKNVFDSKKMVSAHGAPR